MLDRLKALGGRKEKDPPEAPAAGLLRLCPAHVHELLFCFLLLVFELRAFRPRPASHGVAVLCPLTFVQALITEPRQAVLYLEGRASIAVEVISTA